MEWLIYRFFPKKNTHITEGVQTGGRTKKQGLNYIKFLPCNYSSVGACFLSLKSKSVAKVEILSE